MNGITVNGYVGNVDAMRFTQNGKAVFNFSLGDNYGRDKNKTTTWWKVCIFGDAAQEFQNKIIKGSHVEVTGRATVRTYEKKTGGTGFSPEIFCNKILIGNEAKEQSAFRRDWDDAEDNVEL